MENPPPYHPSLLDRRSYPEAPDAIEYRETHVSRLYLTPTLVYKIKKPVDFGFLDFTTPAKRKHFCDEEVRLNRRFAPGVYHGVVPIRRTASGYRVGGEEGEIVEHAVVMKRLPQNLLLDRLLADNAPDLSGEMARLGRELARLHRESEVCRREPEPYRQIVANNWRENFSQIAPLLGPTLTGEGLHLCRTWVERSSSRLARRLIARESQGWVRDGHGDLHAEHICLSEPLCIYDCIEFNRRFRVGDILADIAFLLMDLDRRGRRDLAAILRTVWEDGTGSGGQDDLLRFYKVYRAFVRGKVDTFLACDAAAPEEVRREAAATARNYFNLVLGYLAPQALILTCGVMGVGKSALARTLAPALAAVHLRSDVLRKRLAGLAPTERGDAPFGAGIYSGERTGATYRQLGAETDGALSAGDSVIVDASFADLAQRRRFVELGRARGIPTLIIYLQCDDATLEERLRRRREEGGDPSDGRIDLLPEQRRRFNPLAPDEAALHLDGALDCETNAQRVILTLLQRHGYGETR